jgi:hypothetical protein
VGKIRWFIPFEQLFMYRLKKAPPSIRLNDYIAEYKRTGDERYLAYFLHHYEASLNIRAEKFVSIRTAIAFSGHQADHRGGDVRQAA